MKLKKIIIWKNIKESNEQIEENIKKYCRTNYLYGTKPTINNDEITFTTYAKGSYNDITNALIREKYSQSEELALNRKFNMYGINDEYIAYNSYVESCVAQAKEFVEERNAIFGK